MRLLNVLFLQKHIFITRYYCTFNHAISAANSQISRFGRMGQIDNARQLFDKLPHKTIVAWNSIISAYFQNKKPHEAHLLFESMPERNIVSWNGLISGYVRNGMLNEARAAFEKMPQRNVVSWTALIKGYIEAGLVTEEAEKLFWEMPEEEKNVVSWTVMLGGLTQVGRIDDAWRLYRRMPEKDLVSHTTMIAGLCQDRRVDEAREIFDEMPMRNVVSWTSMISGYVQNGRVDVARKLFEVMPVEKNEVSWTAMLMGYAQIGRIEEAWRLYQYMPIKSIIACNAMILGLGHKREALKARDIFDSMRERDEGTWNSMIKVYERNGFELEALSLFGLMQSVKVRPTFPSLISVLSACASLATLDYGRQIHGHILRSNFDEDVFICSALITMYMKSGEFAKAKRVFDKFPAKDIVMWNSMITGYAQHGLGESAMQVFQELCSSDITPDDVTFVGVFSACSYTGKVKQGKEIFGSMKEKYSVEPTTEHYACVVDMLGRAGCLQEAKAIIDKMPVEPDAIVWGSLMGACRTYNNLDLAEVAAKKLLVLEPKNAGPYILLSNIYASRGKWADVAELRKIMRSKNVSKSPGCSWIEIEKSVHMFTGGESTPHNEHHLIIKKLEELGSLLREEGYNPDGSFVLHDVDEEEKVHSLGHHSEKLAVAYGLLKLPECVPIRVMKNLRVCGDCHSAIKLIAKVTRREIILRDANRFHHFKGGMCSCFMHSIFVFGKETDVSKYPVDVSLVPPGALVSLVQKGLQHLEMEANLLTNDSDTNEDFSFLQPMDLITKSVDELKHIMKDRERRKVATK